MRCSWQTAGALVVILAGGCGPAPKSGDEGPRETSSSSSGSSTTTGGAPTTGVATTAGVGTTTTVPVGTTTTTGGAPTTGVATTAGVGTTTTVPVGTTTGGTSGGIAGTTSGSTGVGASSGDDGTFLVEHDMGPRECDDWTQDCPQGYKCTWYASDGGNSWNASKCVEIMEDPAQIGEPCFVVGNGVSGVDNCALWAYCWDTDAENQGTCVGLCMGTVEAPVCPQDFACAAWQDGIPHLCLPCHCDPLMQDCELDEVCVPAPVVQCPFVCVLDASGDEGQAHDPCEYEAECDPGLACVDATAAVECDGNAPGCCEPYCDLTVPNTCPGQGQECEALFAEGQAPPGDEDVGVCKVPG